MSKMSYKCSRSILTRKLMVRGLGGERPLTFLPKLRHFRHEDARLRAVLPPVRPGSRRGINTIWVVVPAKV